MAQDKESKLILFFEEIDTDDIPFVGGKNASLGEMIRNLKSKGIKIPEGFAITSYAYDYFVKKAGIEKKIKDILKDLDTNIEGRDIIIIEDIIDSGRTLNYLIKNLEARNPRSVEICALLDKDVPRKTVNDVKYKGFEIPNKYVIGYGLDVEEKFRNLPYIGLIEE